MLALERTPAGHTLLRDQLLPVLEDESSTKVTMYSSARLMTSTSSVYPKYELVLVHEWKGKAPLRASSLGGDEVRLTSYTPKKDQHSSARIPNSVFQIQPHVAWMAGNCIECLVPQSDVPYLQELPTKRFVQGAGFDG